MIVEIKPCPFCGGLDSHTESCYFTVKEKMISGNASINECYIAWNTRHIPEGYAIVSADCIQISLSALEFWVKWIKDNSSGDMEPIEHHYATGAIREIKAMIAAAQDEPK